MRVAYLAFGSLKHSFLDMAAHASFERFIATEAFIVFSVQFAFILFSPSLAAVRPNMMELYLSAHTFTHSPTLLAMNAQDARVASHGGRHRPCIQH